MPIYKTDIFTIHLIQGNETVLIYSNADNGIGQEVIISSRPTYAREEIIARIIKLLG